MRTSPDVLFTHALTTVEAAEGFDAFARSMFIVAVITRAENTNGFQPVRIKWSFTVVIGDLPSNEPWGFRTRICRGSVEGSSHPARAVLSALEWAPSHAL